jgi:hypothetical protein
MGYLEYLKIIEMDFGILATLSPKNVRFELRVPDVV